MAGRGGRGGGRGRGMSFSIDLLGFGRGEALPPPMLQPPTLFPPLESKPVALQQGEEQEYLLALKQEFRGTMKDSKFFTSTVEKKKDIERYSDRYQQVSLSSGTYDFDWKRLPKELKVIKRKKKGLGKVAPNVKNAADRKKLQDVTKKLEELEAKEKSGSGAEEEEEEQEEQPANQEGADDDGDEIMDEDDLEEGTDYAQNYFENGENYLDEEDDNLDDGPTY